MRRYQPHKRTRRLIRMSRMIHAKKEIKACYDTIGLQGFESAARDAVEQIYRALERLEGKVDEQS